MENVDPPGASIDFGVSRLPPDVLRCEAGEAHFWLSALDLPDHAVAELAALLSPEERARAERFRLPRDRRRYTVCRGRLRLLLAAYTRTAPRLLDFTCGPHGKPALSAAFSCIDLQFNIAHSGDLALFGFAPGLRIGVDVEQVRPDLPWRDLARRFFAPAEADALEALPASSQREAFAACWTRKEAFVKATGEGLSRSLKSFEVSVLPDEAEPGLRIGAESSFSPHWRLLSLRIEPGYAAAVAIERDAGPTRCRAWRLP